MRASHVYAPPMALVTTEGQTTSVFDRAAIAAAEQFKYQPRVQDGVAVDVHGVRNRFVFELD